MHVSGRLPQVSVIITCYNQAPTLRLLLATLGRQTVASDCFEVIVADDGSQSNVAELCEEVRTSAGFFLRFVTQPDQGYRKSKILNQALRHARADYLVFLDADVILEKHFIEDHLSLREEGHFVCGRRVDLGPALTERVLAQGLDSVRHGQFDGLSLSLLMSGWKKDSESVKRALRIPFQWLRSVMGYNRPLDLLGSNFSAWKEDIVAINGFNEALESYWGEDGDLFIRLVNSGRKPIGGKGLCVQYHLFHERRTPTPENIAHCEKQSRDQSYRWAAKGYQESSEDHGKPSHE